MSKLISRGYAAYKMSFLYNERSSFRQSGSVSRRAGVASTASRAVSAHSARRFRRGRASCATHCGGGFLLSLG